MRSPFRIVCIHCRPTFIPTKSTEWLSRPDQITAKQVHDHGQIGTWEIKSNEDTVYICSKLLICNCPINTVSGAISHVPTMTRCHVALISPWPRDYDLKRSVADLNPNLGHLGISPPTRHLAFQFVKPATIWINITTLQMRIWNWNEKNLKRTLRWMREREMLWTEQHFDTLT